MIWKLDYYKSYKNKLNSNIKTKKNQFYLVLGQNLMKQVWLSFHRNNYRKINQ